MGGALAGIRVSWGEFNRGKPLLGIQQAQVGLYIRRLGDRRPMNLSVKAKIYAAHGYFRFAHATAFSPQARPSTRRPAKIRHAGYRTQGLDRLELIRFLQVA